MGCSLPGSSVRGIFQTRILEWVTMSFSRGSSRPRDGTALALAKEFFTTEPPGKPSNFIYGDTSQREYLCTLQGQWPFAYEKERKKSLSCVWLCDPMDCSLPGSSVHGIFQTRILEWVAISFFILMFLEKPFLRLPYGPCRVPGVMRSINISLPWFQILKHEWTYSPPSLLLSWQWNFLLKAVGKPRQVL